MVDGGRSFLKDRIGRQMGLDVLFFNTGLPKTIGRQISLATGSLEAAITRPRRPLAARLGHAPPPPGHKGREAA